MIPSTPATVAAGSVSASPVAACDTCGSPAADATSHAADAVAFFDRIYADAEGDTERIPWSDGHAHPALVRWLDVVAPGLVRAGGRVVVPACGFGADAIEVARRGYDVTGFDAAPTALHWARRLDPDGTVNWVEADLFRLPSRWRHRFDLVVEVNTVQALEPALRGRVLSAMSQLLAPHGRLLAIGRAAPDGEDPERQGPPWPLDPARLVTAAAEARLEPEGEVQCFTVAGDPERHCFRGLFRRSG